MTTTLDNAAISVADVAAVVVALGQDAVADSECRAGCQQLYRSERAGRAQEGPGAGVQFGDIGTAVGDHHGAVRIAVRMPVGDQPGEYLVVAAADVEPVVAFVDLECSFVAEPERLHGLALPVVALAPVFPEFDRVESSAQHLERATGFDRGQLAGIAGEDELASRGLNEREQLPEVTRSEHSGFVDDQYGAFGQGAWTVKQAGDACAAQARLVLELASRLPR